MESAHVFRIEVEDAADSTHLRSRGDRDMASAGELPALVPAVSRDGSSAPVRELGARGLIDSTGLRALLTIVSQTVDQRLDVLIGGPQPSFLRRVERPGVPEYLAPHTEAEGDGFLEA